MQPIHTAAAASQRAAQFASRLPLPRQLERTSQRLSAHLARPSYSRRMRALIQSSTHQMNTGQAERQKASFLAGVEVQEICLEAWNQANRDYVSRWFI